MNFFDVERTLNIIGDHIRLQMLHFDIGPVTCSLMRSRLHVGIGDRSDSYAFVVRTSCRSFAEFEVWDWDDDELVVWRDLTLQGLQHEQVAGLLCAAVRERLSL